MSRLVFQWEEIDYQSNEHKIIYIIQEHWTRCWLPFFYIKVQLKKTDSIWSKALECLPRYERLHTGINISCISTRVTLFTFFIIIFFFKILLLFVKFRELSIYQGQIKQRPLFHCRTEDHNYVIEAEDQSHLIKTEDQAMWLRQRIKIMWLRQKISHVIRTEDQSHVIEAEDQSCDQDGGSKSCDRGRGSQSWKLANKCSRI